MIQERTVLKVADNTGAREAMIIGRVGSSMKKYLEIGDIVKVAVKKAIPDGAVQNHSVHRAVIVRTAKEFRRVDGSYIRFDDNAAVLLDGNTKNPKGTRIFGPIARELKALGFDKIISLAPEVL